MTVHRFPVPQLDTTKRANSEQLARVQAAAQAREHVLREQLGQEIERAVDESIREVGATSAKDLGRVMKAVMGRIAGKGADGRTVNEIVRRKLGA